MMKSMETILTERLKEIQDQLKYLLDEKAKTKKALDVFKGNDAQSLQQSTPRQSSNGEPIFKDKIRAALIEQFPNGATANELLKYVNERWERQIIRSSLSPQLSRLKKEGVILLDNDIWKLAKNNEAPRGTSLVGDVSASPNSNASDIDDLL